MIRIGCMQSYSKSQETFTDLTKSSWEASAASNHSLAGDRSCFGVS